MNIQTFGQLDERSKKQLENCMIESAEYGVLCADHHPGYSMPIGGAIAYSDHISPSGVGYDIGCGNKAVKTNLKASEIDVTAVMNEIYQRISFGIGRINDEPVDHPVFERIATANFKPQRKLLDKAAEQLGTVGSGNHYVDLFEDEDGWLWIGVHFGSRGFGHTTASGFLAMNKGLSFEERTNEGEMDSPPVLFKTDSEIGQAYIEAMTLAGEYAYAGRDVVVDKVLEILGATTTFEVHNHHNFAWLEEHFGKKYWVVRKGCTPAQPGQKGFVGSTMGESSVILEGVDSDTSKSSLYSTVHGAGRVMSRTQAAGKFRGWGNKRHQVSRGVVNWRKVTDELKEKNIQLRGGGADEAPEAYKRLDEVLQAHEGTINIIHRLKPIGVAMAGGDVYDPYKD